MRYQQLGLIHHDRDKATPGITLFSALSGRNVYAVDMAGEVVHEWRFDAPLGGSFQALGDGHLLVSQRTKEGPPIFEGKLGRMIEVDGRGETVWQHVDHGQHHDARRLPGGNTLYIAWEPLDASEAARVKGGVPGTE